MASPDAPQTPVTNVYLAEDMSGYFDVERTQPRMTALYQSPQGLYYLDQAHTVRVLLHFTPGMSLEAQHVSEESEAVVSEARDNDGIVVRRPEVLGGRSEEHSDPVDHHTTPLARRSRGARGGPDAVALAIENSDRARERRHQELLEEMRAQRVLFENLMREYLTN
ncbi:hypothetical protein N1851_016954 [Merluccius polli]|uniref:Uncharacterized protein n=1 Tax=Merluccius polli TaxID=89951 RepID=A0AA47MQB1_MERPO|nr:hypothetical protein N1851_016954 [Merluccius polli]